MNTQKGFTLIELMIVLAIVGILAAIAIPAYQNYIARSQVSEGTTLASDVKTQVLTAYSRNGKCPDNSMQGGNGLAAANTIKGKFITSVTAGSSKGGGDMGMGGADSCTIVALFNNEGNKEIQGRTLTYTLKDNGGSNEWICTTTLDAKHAPEDCRV